MAPVMRRTAAAAALITAAAVLGPLQPATSADAPDDRRTGAGSDTIRVKGRVLVLHGEGDEDRYSLQLRSGRIVPLADGFEAEPLSFFSGTLAVPGTTSARLLEGAGRSAALARAQSLGGLLVRESRVISPRPAAGPTHHTTYVAKVTNFGAIGLSDAAILSNLAAAQEYWVRQSNGLIGSWATATGVVPVSSTAGSAAAGCGLGNGGADFDAVTSSVGAAAFPGVDFSGASPNHLVVVVPDNCGGTAAGRARVGVSLANGGPSIVQAMPGSMVRIVMEHEYGHNVGLQHSDNKVAEYGGVYEVMGAGPDDYPNPALGTALRHEEGALAPGEMVDGLAGGEWTLAPRSATTGLRGIHFINPDDGVRHFVDYRDGTGADAGTWYAQNSTVVGYGQTYRTGVVIEREHKTSGSFLVDTNGAAADTGAMRAGDPAWSNASGTLRVAVSGASTVTISRTAAPPLTGGTVTAGPATAMREVSASASGFTPTPVRVRYQWFLNGQPLAQAESPSYTPSLDMAGGTLSVTATAYAVGREPVSRTATQTVAPATWHVYAAPNAPGIAGTPRVGETLTAVGIDWLDWYRRKPAGYAPTYQWLRGGVPIPGATAATYQLTAADVRAYIQVVESPRAPGFSTTAWARSASTAPIAAGTLATARPKIKGEARVGRAVKAVARGWTPGTSLHYLWYADGKKIKKVRGKKLVLTRAMRGRRIQVRVIGIKTGYVTAMERSKKVRVR